jgi:uroporphyrinogen-III decarboxylase
MNARERVLAAFAHVEPDRVPRWCGASPEFLAKARRQLNLPDDESFFVRIGDDFGGHNGPLLGPEHFDRFMLPHLNRLIALGHAYKLKVQLHCCGGYEPLIPAMIAAGLDGLHAVQQPVGLSHSRMRKLPPASSMAFVVILETIPAGK